MMKGLVQELRTVLNQQNELLKEISQDMKDTKRSAARISRQLDQQEDNDGRD